MDLWVILVWGAILVVALVTCVLLVVRDVRDRRNRRRGAPSSEGDLSGADAIDRTLTLGVSQHVGGAGGRGGAGI
jgi:hypothetical protein